MTLYHGSSVADIQVLEPRSKLHGSQGEHVVYLSGSLPYALVYIWDSHKTNYSRKWITCGLKGESVYYEEMFPDQLKAFYEGVSGYLYCVKNNEHIKRMPETHENMFYSSKPVYVDEMIPVADVYKELLMYEKKGILRVDRFLEASEMVKAERVERIATIIKMDNLLECDDEKACFFQYYCKEAWELAKRTG